MEKNQTHKTVVEQKCKSYKDAVATKEAMLSNKDKDFRVKIKHSSKTGLFRVVLQQEIPESNDK